VKQLGIRKGQARPYHATVDLDRQLRQPCSLQNPLGLGLDSVPGRIHPAPQPIDEPAAVTLLSFPALRAGIYFLALEESDPRVALSINDD